jgi:hypothetical protein
MVRAAQRPPQQYVYTFDQRKYNKPNSIRGGSTVLNSAAYVQCPTVLGEVNSA